MSAFYTILLPMCSLRPLRGSCGLSVGRLLTYAAGNGNHFRALRTAFPVSQWPELNLYAKDSRNHSNGANALESHQHSVTDAAYAIVSNGIVPVGEGIVNTGIVFLRRTRRIRVRARRAFQGYVPARASMSWMRREMDRCSTVRLSCRSTPATAEIWLMR